MQGYKPFSNTWVLKNVSPICYIFDSHFPSIHTRSASLLLYSSKVMGLLKPIPLCEGNSWSCLWGKIPGPHRDKHVWAHIHSCGLVRVANQPKAACLWIVVGDYLQLIHADTESRDGAYSLITPSLCCQSHFIFAGNMKCSVEMLKFFFLETLNRALWFIRKKQNISTSLLSFCVPGIPTNTRRWATWFRFHMTFRKSSCSL